MFPPSQQRAASPPAGGHGDSDPVTRLPTRRQFLDLLGEEIEGLGAGNGSLAVLLVDLDGFRRINRDLGHGVGDQLLFSAGRRLLAAVRGDDVVARAGGDEFVVLSRGLAAGSDVVDLAAAILSAFDDPFDLGVEVLTATASVGVVVTDQPDAAAESLVGDAEAALERDRSGTRRFEVFDAGAPRADPLPGRDRPRAGGRPRLPTRSRSTTSRSSTSHPAGSPRSRPWPAGTIPSAGAISPELFVPIAEESGCVGELLTRLLAHAARDFPRSPPAIRRGRSRSRSTSPPASSPPIR